MGFQKRLVKVGLAKQSAKGSPAVNPTWDFGVESGQAVNANIAEGPLNLTWPGRLVEGFERTELKPGGQFKTVATPKLIGLLLFGAMGADTVAQVLQVPTNVALTTSASGGTVAAGTHGYRVTALNGAGETTASAEVTIVTTGSTSTVTVTWPAVPGATSYKVYGRTASSELLMGTVSAAPASAFYSFLDDGSVTPSGALPGGNTATVTNYVHTFTTFDDVPYLTLFGQEGPSSYLSVQDCKIDELTLSFDKLSAMRAETKLLGCQTSFLGSPWTAGADERVSGGYLNASGQPFAVDGVAATVTGGSVKLSNKLVPIMTAYQAFPSDVFPGLLSIDWSLKVIPDDLTVWRKVVMGSATGTTGSAVPYYGSLSFKWALDANTDLTFYAQRAKMLSAFPDASPDGGPAEITVEANVSQVTSGTPVTATLRNAVASY